MKDSSQPPKLPIAGPSFPTSHLPILKEGPTMDNSIRKEELMQQQSPTPKRGNFKSGRDTLQFLIRSKYISIESSL